MPAPMAPVPTTATAPRGPSAVMAPSCQTADACPGSPRGIGAKPRTSWGESEPVLALEHDVERDADAEDHHRRGDGAAGLLRPGVGHVLPEPAGHGRRHGDDRRP